MSQTIEVKGELIHVGKPRHWGENQENYATKVYIDTDPDSTFPSQLEAEVYKDQVNLSKFKVGEEVVASLNFKGATREYKGKKMFFNNIGIWKMELTSPAPTAPPPDSQEEDDLPF